MENTVMVVRKVDIFIYIRVMRKLHKCGIFRTFYPYFSTNMT